MEAPPVIGELVERFENHREIYCSADYNEAQLRQEFLNPFFEALGWDVNNRQSHAEAYKDVSDVVKVVHEAGISKKVLRLKPLGVIKG